MFEVGTVHWIGKQRYRVTAHEPYTRRDGGQTTLAVMDTECPGCGRPFQVKTPTSAKAMSPTRRCKACADPGRPVKVTPRYRRRMGHLKREGKLLGDPK